MSLDTTVPRSRRALLGVAVGAAAATAASALGRPALVRAGTGDPLVLGQSNSAGNVTQLEADVKDFVLTVTNTSQETVNGAIGAASNFGYALVGDTYVGTAVYAGVTGDSGTAVVASATRGGFALDVRGKAKFSRSKKVTIGAGKSSLKVTLAGVTTSSLVFAVLHTNRSGVYVRAVVPSTGSFTIYLNKAVTAATYVAYFVVN